MRVTLQSKADLRAAARARRREIPEEERARLSERIAERALALPGLQEARVVGCYASMGSEVATDTILRGLIASGVRVGVPVLAGEGMRFVELTHPWALVRDGKGAPEPRQPWNDISSASIDALVVPGVLFGRDGSRLGQGGGHYDRFLKEHPRPLRIGLAFEAQMVDRVATEAHDEGMDLVVTEDRVVTPGRSTSSD
jgi:5-formyltetrahydrofolate cyclo-ligase